MEETLQRRIGANIDIDLTSAADVHWTQQLKSIFAAGKSPPLFYVVWSAAARLRNTRQ